MRGPARRCCFVLAILIASAFGVGAQTSAPGVAGEWAGTLGTAAGSLRLVLHITGSAGKLNATLDSIDQGARGIPTQHVTLTGKAFSFVASAVHGTYKATLADDGETLTGTWNQGTPLALELKRSSKQSSLASSPKPAVPPVALANLKPVLDREFAPLLNHGVLAKSTGGGVAIGVLDHRQSRVFAYGTAQPDSLFEIGSITKTFTGLLLAQMVVQKQVSLDAPVRSLLPAGLVPKPDGSEITLLDLATQHSGLPRLPDNLHPADPSDPYADYDARRLTDFLRTHGLARPPDAKFLYSNLGFGLLGYALACRAAVPYAQLVTAEITGPLRMPDTVITLSAAQQKRLLQGHSASNDAVHVWNLNAIAGAGGLKSSALDMLAYLNASLHPQEVASKAPANSPLASLPAALALDHQLRAEGLPGNKIALAWFFDQQTRAFWHDGGTAGYTSRASFNPDEDRAIVVLYNRNDATPGKLQLVDRVAANVTALLSGKAVTPLED